MESVVRDMIKARPCNIIIQIYKNVDNVYDKSVQIIDCPVKTLKICL